MQIRLRADVARLEIGTDAPRLMNVIYTKAQSSQGLRMSS